MKLKESIYFLTLICSRGSFNSGLHWISTRLDPWSKGVITTQAWINCPEIYFEKFVFKKFQKKINLCTFDCSKSISLISSSVVVHNCHKIITDVSFFLVTFWISTKIGWHQCRHYKYVKKLLFFEAICNFFISNEKQVNKQLHTRQCLPWNITCIKSSSHMYAKSPSTSASRPPRKVVLRSTSKNSITNCKQFDKIQNCEEIIAYKYLPLRQINDPRPCKKSVYLREPKGFASIACSLFAWSGPTYKTPILCASCLKLWNIK